jgi:hypothetical protein
VSDARKKARTLAVGTAVGFAVLFGDMMYEGGRSIVGQYLGLLGPVALTGREA